MKKFFQIERIFSALISRAALFRQLSGAAILQGIQILISAAIGFAIVRHLPKEEYAIFTLLNLGGATLVGWASIGIVTIFIPFANRVDPSHRHLRQTTAVFRKLDSPMVVVGVVAGLLFWLISAYRNHWLDGWFLFGMSCALAASLCQYAYRLPECAFKVSGNPLLPFAVTVGSELLRLFLIAAVMLMALQVFMEQGPSLLMALALVTSAAGLYVLNGRFRRLENHPSPVTNEHRQLYWGLLSPLLFPAYFYHGSQFFRGWLIYLVSGATVIADAAAIGRLMVLFAMMDKAVELVIIPRLGAIGGHKRFLSRLAPSFMAVFFIAAALWGSAWAFPKVWLWILGGQYTGLNTALLWAVAAAGVERLSGLVLFAQLARGDTKNQWWVPVLATAIYVGYVAVIGLDTVDKATAGLFMAAISNLVAQLCILGWRIRKFRPSIP